MQDQSHQGIRNKRRGYTYYLILGGGQAMNLECDVENALKAGEVIVDGYTAKANRPNTRQQNEVLSIADELRKL